MLRHLRTRTAASRVLVLLAFLALAFKVMVPPGFMVGSSLSAPLVFCDGQAPAMATMAHDGHHRPAEAPAHNGDHPCPFAGHGATPVVPDLGAPVLAGVSVADAAPDLLARVAAPGRGMAAPPPPSHAPPASHA